MSWNFKFFQRINALVGKNHWLDAFGRAGAEFVIFAMVGWYITADLVTFRPDWADVFRPLITLGVMALGGWLLNIWLGIIVKEPRPHVTHPESKLLFKPWMSWKSFPSDHAMLAWLVFFAALLFNLPYKPILFPLMKIDTSQAGRRLILNGQPTEARRYERRACRRLSTA